MKFTFNWLKEFVEINLAPADLAHALTMAGLEVESFTAALEPETGKEAPRRKMQARKSESRSRSRIRSYARVIRRVSSTRSRLRRRRLGCATGSRAVAFARLTMLST
jgi:hypothetical protein